MVKTTAKVEGMMCNLCEAHIQQTIRRNFCIEKVTASRAKNKVVILSPTLIDEKKLRGAIANIGYTVRNMNAKPYVKRGLLSGFRK